MNKWVTITIIGIVFGMALIFLSLIKISILFKQLKKIEDGELFPDKIRMDLLKYTKLGMVATVIMFIF